jgi:chromosome segregation ATPase
MHAELKEIRKKLDAIEADLEELFAADEHTDSRLDATAKVKVRLETRVSNLEEGLVDVRAQLARVRELATAATRRASESAHEFDEKTLGMAAHLTKLEASRHAGAEVTEDTLKAIVAEVTRLAKKPDRRSEAASLLLLAVATTVTIYVSYGFGEANEIRANHAHATPAPAPSSAPDGGTK